jgi:hypothetical protein
MHFLELRYEQNGILPNSYVLLFSQEEQELSTQAPSFALRHDQPCILCPASVLGYSLTLYCRLRTPASLSSVLFDLPTCYLA